MNAINPATTTTIKRISHRQNININLMCIGIETTESETYLLIKIMCIVCACVEEYNAYQCM